MRIPSWVVSIDDIEQITNLKVKLRLDWPAVFSTNQYGHIWPCVGYGYSNYTNRTLIQGVSQILDRVAEKYRQVRPEGGRFFISEEGAYYQAEGEPRRKFVTFVCEETPDSGASTYNDGVPF